MAIYINNYISISEQFYCKDIPYTFKATLDPNPKEN